MRFIDASEIRRVLTFPLLVAALEAAHRRPKIEVQDGSLGSEREIYFVRHAVDRGRAVAAKLITSFPANLAQGTLPAVQAVCVLFDGTNGAPLAVIDGTEITYWRTAANSALGAKLLANPVGGHDAGGVGAGEMAKWLVRAHRAARPSIQSVVIWNRTKERAVEVAALLHGEGVDAEATADLDAATRSADRWGPARGRTDPLIRGVNLKPGVHLDLVGGYTPQTREADDEAARRAVIFVDRRNSAFDGVGDILQPIENGAISAADVRGDLCHLVPGAVGGQSPTEISFSRTPAAAIWT